MAWTALRHGFYGFSGIAMISNALELACWKRRRTEIVLGLRADDLAEAAAIILTEEGKFEGPTPPLTARKASISAT